MRDTNELELLMATSLPTVFMVCKNPNVKSFEVTSYSEAGAADILLNVEFTNGDEDCLNLLPFTATDAVPNYDLSSFSEEDQSEVQVGLVVPIEGVTAILVWPN